MITERRSLGGEAKVYRAPTAEVIARARLRCRVNKTVPAQLNHVAQLASDAGGWGSGWIRGCLVRNRREHRRNPQCVCVSVGHVFGASHKQLLIGNDNTYKHPHCRGLWSLRRVGPHPQFLTVTLARSKVRAKNMVHEKLSTNTCSHVCASKSSVT